MNIYDNLDQTEVSKDNSCESDMAFYNWRINNLFTTQEQWRGSWNNTKLFTTKEQWRGSWNNTKLFTTQEQ